MGLSVIVDFKAKLYPFMNLHKANVVNDAFRGRKVLVAYSRSNGTAKAWNRGLPEFGELTFEKVPAQAEGQEVYTLRDKETGSAWSWMTGTALTGRLEGAGSGRWRTTLF